MIKIGVIALDEVDFQRAIQYDMLNDWIINHDHWMKYANDYAVYDVQYMYGKTMAEIYWRKIVGAMGGLDRML